MTNNKQALSLFLFLQLVHFANTFSPTAPDDGERDWTAPFWLSCLLSVGIVLLLGAICCGVSGSVCLSCGFFCLPRLGGGDNEIEYTAINNDMDSDASDACPNINS